MAAYNHNRQETTVSRRKRGLTSNINTRMIYISPPQIQQYHTDCATAFKPLSAESTIYPLQRMSLSGEFDVSTDTVPGRPFALLLPQNTSPVTNESFTAFTLTVRSRPRPAGSSASSFHSTTGRKNLELRSENEPSYVSCSFTCAGEFDVAAEANRVESTGASTTASVRGEFAVRALTVKAPPAASEALEYRPISPFMKLIRAR